MSHRLACILCLFGLLVGCCAVAAPVAGEVVSSPAVLNESDQRPYAEAGLDQTVPVGAVVYLDAYGSRAATGNLTGYQWRIERPDGTTTVPDCPRCELTQVRPTQSGEYAVTLTVEDEAGRTAADTMYVTVRDRAAPNATLVGPPEMLLNKTVTLDLDASVADGQLRSVEWYVDGAYRRGEFLDTDSVDDPLRFAPDSIGRHTISAVVRDDNGTARRVRHNVTVRDPVVFAIRITDAPSSLEAGTEWAADFAVTNTGSRTDTQQIRLISPITGNIVDSDSVTLNPGQTLVFDDEEQRFDGYGGFFGTPPTLSWDPPSVTGSYSPTIKSDTDEESPTVTFADPPDFRVVDITNVRTGRFTSGTDDFGRVTADVTVENVGGSPGSGNLEYSWNGDSRGAPVSLAPGESATVRNLDLVEPDYAYDPSKTQTYTAGIDGSSQSISFNFDDTGGGGFATSDYIKSISFSTPDIEEDETGYVTIQSVTTQAGDTYSGSKYYNDIQSGAEGYVWKDQDFSTDGGVYLRSITLAAGDATRGTSLRVRGGTPGTVEICAREWYGGRYEAGSLVGNGEKSDCASFEVDSKGGGGNPDP